MSIVLGLIVWLFVSQTDFDCLTEAVYYEAGNQSLAGKISVAHVIRNRVKDNRWPATYCGVVREQGQFSYYWDGKPEPRPKNNSRMEQEALFESELASFLTLLIPLDITRNALYYHNDKIKPPVWTERLNLYTQIDNHLFYTD